MKQLNNLTIKKGFLLVIDGIDGSGKTTQINLLVKSFKEQKIPYEVISFPRYEDNLYGKLIKRYLDGEFGSMDAVNPYLMACVFAGDRLLAKPLIEKWLHEGKVVIADRYVSSSCAYMGANLPKDKREEFFKWLERLEYETNGIPKEDLTILLTVDPKVGQKNVLGKQKLDLHEENIKHLEEANRIYLSLAKKISNWYVVDCIKNGKMKSRDDIHQEIITVVYDKI